MTKYRTDVARQHFAALDEEIHFEAPRTTVKVVVLLKHEIHILIVIFYGKQKFISSREQKSEIVYSWQAARENMPSNAQSMK